MKQPLKPLPAPEITKTLTKEQPTPETEPSLSKLITAAKPIQTPEIFRLHPGPALCATTYFGKKS